MPRAPRRQPAGPLARPIRGWLLLALAGLAACGDDGPAPDAAAPTDGRPGDASAGDAARPDAPPGDLAVRLAAIPGMTVEEEPPVEPGYRTFRLAFEQPVRHEEPGGETFPQRLALLHRVADPGGPLVLLTEGYYLWSGANLSEPAQLLGASQLAVEHRFFAPSSPEPPDWDALTIEQAAADVHRVVEALRPLYPGRWVSTGASKGGMAAVYHRRFFPDDVAGTIAYVAPHSLGAPDGRYPAYLDAIGDAACRDALRALQAEVLGRRAEMLARLDALASTAGMSFDLLGRDMALEHAVLEVPFAFWQYGGAAGCAGIPPTTATSNELFEFVDRIVGFFYVADAGVEMFQPYYAQAARQLGYPAYDEASLAGLLLHPGTYTAVTYAPPGAPLVHEPEAMQDVSAWLTTSGRTLLFLYGENDPWTAGAFAPGGATDSYLHVVPDGNHGALLVDLPEPARAEAIATVRRWGGRGAKAPGGVPAVRRPPAVRAPL